MVFALLRSFLLIEMNKVMLDISTNVVRTIAVQETRVAKSFIVVL
jgi:hypothetical protein